MNRSFSNFRPGVQKEPGFRYRTMRPHLLPLPKKGVRESRSSSQSSPDTRKPEMP